MANRSEDSEYEIDSRRNQPKDKKKEGILDLVLKRPLRWLRMLIEELHWSFFFGVIIVYGVSQGLGKGLSKVSTQYYFKDEQKIQPSQAQIYVGFIQIPWIIKPVWGLLTDVVPVWGYRRRPYFIFAGKFTDQAKKLVSLLLDKWKNVIFFSPFYLIIGVLAMISMMVLWLHTNLHLALALSCLVAASAGVAVADVTIDACVTQCSISHPTLAADMQSLCGLSSSIGSLVGFSLSGVLVHLFGSKVGSLKLSLNLENLYVNVASYACIYGGFRAML